jgi:DNA recombination-dependent growth factor C
MREFEQYDKDHAEFVAMMKSYSIEDQMLILCIRQEDLLVPPEVYLDKLYSIETIEDVQALKALRKQRER